VAVALAGVLGCQKQCFLSERDFNDAQAIGFPRNLECDPSLSITRRAGTVPPPTTVDDTKRPARYLSLREAIAIALENGTVGLQSAATPGSASDTLGGFSGTGVQSADAIRVLALDPAIVATSIETSLSKFDTLWNTALTWNRTETPLGISPTTFVQTGSFLPNVSADNLNFTSSLEKPLPTGGVAGITFGLNTQWNTPSSRINPAIQPDIQFVFEQPLLKGFGVEINQLLDAHPDSKLMPFATGNTGEGILITRIRLDQQRAEFERNVNFLLLNVEAAYWSLYGAYHQLYSREWALRYAYETWRLTNLAFPARARKDQLEQQRVQYEQFRSQRLTALSLVLDSERQLRGLLGMKIEDGYRLVPTDSPILTPYTPDWKSALDEALARRPELILARQDLRFRQLDLIRQRDNLLPDLRFLATDTVHSVGSHLDEGSSPDNAFHKLFSDPFNNFSLGFQMNVPLGFRAANAGVRAAQLNLQRSYLSLRAEEDKAERFLGLAYRQVFEFQRQIQINQAALRAAQAQLDAYNELFQRGRPIQEFGADLILAQQNWSNNAVNLYNAITQYNNALATLEFAKGAIMERDSVLISDGPLPQCAMVRAVDHERQRTAALVLHERPVCKTQRPCQAPEKESRIVPHLAVDKPVPLPALLEGRPPVPDMSDDPAATIPIPPAHEWSASAPEVPSGGG
jgi:outer membrane protein TolC